MDPSLKALLRYPGSRRIGDSLFFRKWKQEQKNHHHRPETRFHLRIHIGLAKKRSVKPALSHNYIILFPFFYKTCKIFIYFVIKIYDVRLSDISNANQEF